MSTKWFGVVVLVLFLTVGVVYAQGAPHPPILVRPANGSTVNSHDVTFCAVGQPGGVVPSEVRFEFYRAPVADFQTAWVGANAQGEFCAIVHLSSNGGYSVGTRGRNQNGESGANEYGINVQADSAPPATRVPGLQGPTAVPDQGPPIRTFTIRPEGGIQLGQTATIHVEVACTPNCGEAKVSIPCGSQDQERNTSGNFDSHWNTNGCGAGNQTVQVCTRSVSDQQGTRPTCQERSYTLAGAPALNSPTANLQLDRGSIQAGECATLSWQTSNASHVEVNIEGQLFYTANDSKQVCPGVTRTYSLRASNGNDNDATRSVTLVVNGAPIPPGNSNSGGQGGPQAGNPISGFVPSDARQSGVPGGVDLIIYAYSRGFRNADNSNNSANGWYLSDPYVWQADWGQICADVYGSNFIAVNPNNTKDGWRCVVPGSSNTTNPPVQSNNNCGSLQARLQPGQIAVVTQAGFDLNLRAGPGVTEPIRGEIDSGDTVTVISGPQCRDGYNWFQLQTSQGTWWAAESGSGDYWLVVYTGQSQLTTAPVQPSSGGNCTSTRLTVGGQAVVTPGTPNRLRSGPGTGYDRITSIPAGGTMQVIGGPSCGNGYIWWQVSYNGITGWTAEGGDGSYWLDPIGQSVVPTPDIVEVTDPTTLLPSAPRMCVPSTAATSSGWSLIPETLAAEQGRFDNRQCTSWPNETYNELVEKCLPEHPADAHTWDEQFKDNCSGFSIDSSPDFGDIVVWEASVRPPLGHVGIVTDIHPGGSFTFTQRNESGRGDLTDVTYSTESARSGISFIHMICSIRPTPIVASGIPPYLAIPKIISSQYGGNEFVFYDTDRGIYDGVQFQIAGYSNGATLFSVDIDWTSSHPNWRSYWWTYVHICAS